MKLVILAVYTKMLNNEVDQIIKVYDTTKEELNLNPSLTLLKCKNIIQVDYYNYFGSHYEKEKIINEFVIGNNVGVNHNFRYLKQILV